ncbi:MAG: hypothetical protein CVV03_00460 [Firmicutes bacterium HGW-Firmicutes-8]|nr:MAG: hypothetical protein CVV03_00460 [Firmicutes bacterium HGW-Firmicutes-8]
MKKYGVIEMTDVESLRIGTVIVSQELMGLVQYHGHLCPELAIGYRVSKIAITELGITRGNSLNFIAGAANSSSAVDAIQYLTGCTIGKQSFFIEDTGKHVYFFARRPLQPLTGQGLIIKIKTPVYNPQLLNKEMAKDVETQLQDPGKLLQYRAAIDIAIRKILNWPDKRLFDVFYADLNGGLLKQNSKLYN